MKQPSTSRKSRPRNGTRKPSRSANQSNGSRMENRVRGNPKQLLDKYKLQAREARQAGDRITAEYYYQFADHYQRVINEIRLGCGGVFEDYREPVRRPVEDSYDEEDPSCAALGDDRDEGEENSDPAVLHDDDLGAGSSDGVSGRPSRRVRAARAEGEEQRPRRSANERRARSSYGQPTESAAADAPSRPGGRPRRKPPETAPTDLLV